MLLWIAGALAFPNPTTVRVEFPLGGAEAVASIGCASEYLDQLPDLLRQLERCEGSYSFEWLAEQGAERVITDTFRLPQCWSTVAKTWPKAYSLNTPELGACTLKVRRWTPYGAAVGTPETAFEANPSAETKPEAPPLPEGMVSFRTSDAVYQSTFGRQVGQLRYCYEQRLRDKPELRGELSLNGTIQAGRPDWKVSDDRLGDSVLTECVLSKLKRWKFSTDGLVSVTFTFVPMAL